MKSIKVLVVIAALLGAGACSATSGTNSSGDAGGPNAQVDGGNSEAQVDGGNSEAQVDAGDSGNPETLPFTVPAGGGSVTFGEGSSAVDFAFPASAAGLNVTLSQASAADIGWQDGQVESVIKLEPSGTVFADPIVVKPANGNLMAFVTTSDGTKGKPEPLNLTADGTGVQLKHFSAVVFIPPGKSCTSSSGWGVHPESNAACVAFPGTVYDGFDCKGYDWCQYITAHCCLTQADVDARADKECRLGDPGLEVTYTDSGNADGNHPYCAGECNAVDFSAAPMVTQHQIAQAPPAAAGGTIADGTYVAVADTEYTGVGGPTGDGAVVQGVYVFANGKVDAVEVGGGQVNRWSATFTVGANNTLDAVYTCGRTGTASVPYTVDGSTLKIYVGGGSEELTFSLPCNAIDPSVAPLVTQHKIAQAPPVPSGGAIAAGTYFAVADTEYTGVGGPTGDGAVVQGVYVFGGGTVQAVEVGGGQTNRWSATFATSASNTLDVAFDCGRSGTDSVPYSSDGSTLKIYVGGGSEELTFARQ